MPLRHFSTPRALLGALFIAGTFASFTSQAADEL
ncbi:SipW-dependent-type signal peptide-containing protein, partial [Cronobacter sakazakii]